MDRIWFNQFNKKMVGVTLDVALIALVLANTVSLTILEATLWHLEGYKIFPKTNKHIFLLVCRFTPIALLFLSWNWLSVVIIALFVGSIHPSILYTVRNKINPKVYQRKWLSEPSKGKKTSIINLSLRNRIIGLVASVILFIINLI